MARTTGGDELAQQVRSERAAIAAEADPWVRRRLRVRSHLRTYLAVYALATVWVVLIANFPSIERGVRTVTGGDGNGFASGEPGGSDGWDEDWDDETALGTNGTGGGPGAAATSGRGASAAGGGGGGGGGGGAATGGGGQASGGHVGTVARSGVECVEGARQLPDSAYAAPCVPRWEGDNGGATYRGVTEDTITIVRRGFPESPNQRAVRAAQSQAGFASVDVQQQARDVFLEYFQENYELYGRRVEFIDYFSQHGDSTAEAQSQGREGACLDAEQIMSEHAPFGIGPGPEAGGGQSDPFSDCAAQRQMVVFAGAAYFPESWYRERSPFVWHYVMDCERISYQVAEYIGKRLHGRNARWSGDPLMQQQERRFGVYVPNNDQYQHCVNVYEREAAEQYGASTSARYNYTLDVSRFPDEAARAAVQFRQAGVTSLVLACDPISVIFLTGAATAQRWQPEWVLIGVAGTDLENWARLYDGQVDGSLFGMSQLAEADSIMGPDSEPGRLYKRLTGEEIPEGTTGHYYQYVQLFNMLQVAGPELTPENMARGTWRMPPAGAPGYAFGRWGFQDGPDGTPGGRSHTAIEDSREIYWDASETAPDGDAGAFIATYDGRRFRNGEWPAEEPPVYPGR